MAPQGAMYFLLAVQGTLRAPTSANRNAVMQTLTIKDLAKLLSRSPATIATEVSKSPHKLPPRLILPGSRRVLWLEEDVEEWINIHRANDPL